MANKVSSYTFIHNHSSDTQLKVYCRSKDTAQNMLLKLVKHPKDWELGDAK